MGKINRKALVISLLITIVSGVLLFRFMNAQNVPAVDRPKTSIPVSLRDIQTGDVLSEADIRMQEISSDSVPDGILTDKTEIVGKYANGRILVGEPFRPERLVTPEALSLAYNLPEGYRAVSIFVNESNLLSMQIRTGDYVDVISSWSLKTKDEEEISLTHTVLQNLQVLSLGPNRVLSEKSGGPLQESFAVENAPKTITLAVTPEDAEVLVYNAQFAAFTLALRGKEDHAMMETDGAIITDLVPERLLPFAVMPGEGSGGGSGGGTGTAAGTSDATTGP